MMAVLALAEAVAASAGTSTKEWTSLNHYFACNLHTDRGAIIHLEGRAQETVLERDGRSVGTRGTFEVKSTDKDWAFVRQQGNTNGPLILGSHTIYFDFSDGQIAKGEKAYSLQLTFANRLDGMSGPYGHAVLRDRTQGTPAVREGSDYPITAVGICQMTPKAGTIQ